MSSEVKVSPSRLENILKFSKKLEELVGRVLEISIETSKTTFTTSYATIPEFNPQVEKERVTKLMEALYDHIIGKRPPLPEELAKLPRERLMLEVLAGNIELPKREIAEPVIDQITIDGKRSCVIIVAEI